MKALSLAIALAVSLLPAGSRAHAQTATAAPQKPGDPNITANGVIGEVKVVDAVGKQLIIKTDAGSLVTVVLSDTTDYKRIAPGETTLENATNITFADVAEGDRVLARGKTSDDQKVVPARAVIVMTKADLAKKHEAERAEWRKRGILGVIAALKPETREVTITSRTAAGPQPVIIPVTDKVELRRYAPDSIKFADAKPSTFDELKVGDQLRALGERSADGKAFTPEKVVSGAFRTVAGTVTAVDTTTGEIKINDLEKKQSFTIVVKQDAVLRKFPSEMGGGGMMMMRPGGGAPGGPPAGGQAAPGGQTGQAGQGGPGGGRMGGGNIQDMIERLPTISVADLKKGDTIIVSSTKGADPTRLTAISLISGADTLLSMLAPRPAGGGQTAPNPSAGLGSGIQFGIGLP